MKKNIINAICTILVVATTFCACRKEENNSTDNSGDNQIKSSVNIDDYLIEFKEKMKTNKRSNESISIDDAEWHLTALQNFELCDARKFHLNCTSTKPNL